MPFIRMGKCFMCSRCCSNFIILAGAVSSFQEARRKHGLKLILNPDGKTFHCNMLDEKTKLCKIYEHRPNACRTAPVKENPKEWNCGYRFVLVENKEQELAETKKAIDFFRSLPKEMEGNPDG